MGKILTPSKGSFPFKRKPLKQAKVVVGIPSGGVWKAAFGMSLVSLVSYFADVRLGKGIHSQSLSFHNQRSSMTDNNRHAILREALRRERTHILWLDDDMVFPRDTLHRLFAHDRDLVVAQGVTKTIPAEPVAQDLDHIPLRSLGKEGLEEVLQCGIAVGLLRLDCVKRMEPPFFLQEWQPDLQATCGEDVYFCRKLREAGVDIWLDHSLSQEVYHVGDFLYGQQHTKEITEEERFLETRC